MNEGKGVVVNDTLPGEFLLKIFSGYFLSISVSNNMVVFFKYILFLHTPYN